MLWRSAGILAPFRKKPEDNPEKPVDTVRGLTYNMNEKGYR